VSAPDENFAQVALELATNPFFRIGKLQQLKKKTKSNNTRPLVMTKSVTTQLLALQKYW
jgi:hypothetical protein